MQRALLALRAARDDADEATIDATERAITAAIAGDDGRPARRAEKRAGSAREQKAGAGKRLDVKAAQAAARVAAGVSGGKREKTNGRAVKRQKGTRGPEKISLAAAPAMSRGAAFPGDVARQLRLAQQQLAHSHTPLAAQGYPGHMNGHAAGMGLNPVSFGAGAATAVPPKYLQWSAASPARAHVLGARPSGAGVPGGYENAAAAPSRWAGNAWAEVPAVAGHVGGVAAGADAGRGPAPTNMLSFESDLDFPMEAVGLTGLGGPIGAGIGDPLAMDAELGLLLDAPGDGLGMDGGLL